MRFFDTNILLYAIDGTESVKRRIAENAIRKAIVNRDAAAPFFTGYRPQFYFRTTDITGTIELEAGTDMVKPGDNVKVIGELIHPIAMDEGLKLAIREGGHTIASGQVTKIIE